jgi:metal-responsive CopG/Arc/MetJ family transcriptional regulator
MKDRRDITVPMPGSLVDEVEAELEYGNSRAEWIRTAVEMRLEHESQSEE